MGGLGVQRGPDRVHAHRVILKSMEQSSTFISYEPRHAPPSGDDYRIINRATKRFLHCYLYILDPVMGLAWTASLSRRPTRRNSTRRATASALAVDSAGGYRVGPAGEIFADEDGDGAPALRGAARCRSVRASTAVNRTLTAWERWRSIASGGRPPRFGVGAGMRVFRCFVPGVG